MSLPLEHTSTPEEVMFDEALSAIRTGERTRARDLLTRLLKVGHENASYWVWMSAVVDTPKERLFCLKEAVRIDPQNASAIRGLVVMGARQPQEDQILPAKLQRRDWQGLLDRKERTERAKPPIYIFALMGMAFLLIVGLTGFAFFSKPEQSREKRRLVIVVPTQTEVAAAAITVTSTPVPPSGSPTPLWMLLEATYTPTPFYVLTPHMGSEAFGLGVRAMQSGEWTIADNYFRQAATQIAISDPNSPDILYYIGENYRLQGEHSKALETFNELILLAPDFAPAYLGRARVYLSQESGTKIEAAEGDILAAIEKDPNYGEAYLALASLQIDAGQMEEALSTLDQAMLILPDSPLVYLYRAQAFLKLEDSRQALENARRANELDLTLLLPYRVIGEALQIEGDLEESIAALSTYVQFEQEDAQAWLGLANAYLAGDDPKEALKALDRALRLNSQLGDAYLQRASIHFEMGSNEKALKDYETAARFAPESYPASLGIGKALMALDYPGDAWDRFERTRILAETEMQQAELVFWRGQSLEALGELEAAMRDYRRLIEMPADQIDQAWARFAQSRLAALVTKTPTMIPRTPTQTPTSTFTRQPTSTPVPTNTRQPTRTATPTNTSQPTRTTTPTKTQQPTNTVKP